MTFTSPVRGTFFRPRAASAQADVRCRSQVRSPGGFTLIEVLVVVAIIALLVAILLPSLQEARERSRRVICAKNLQQHGYVVMMYAHDHKGHFPRNPSQHTRDNGTLSWWVDTIIAAYDTPGQRDPFDLVKLFKRYTGGEMQIFSCPSNSGPSLNDPKLLQQVYSSATPYLGAHYMMFWNSTCVFPFSSSQEPWAPKPEWLRAGPGGSVPIAQDQFSAFNWTVQVPEFFYVNHGRISDRGYFPGYSDYMSYKKTFNRSACTGINTLFLDGHVSWVRNSRFASGEWSLRVPYSGSALRLGGKITTSGSPVTLPAHTRK